jgi:hypothetical protein
VVPRQDLLLLARVFSFEPGLQSLPGMNMSSP